MLTDPEINAALAEKAMGWKHLEFARSDGSKYVMFMEPSSVESESIRSWNPVEVEFGDERNGPDFLTDPAASQALKEAMRAKRWRWYIQLREEGFLARFYRFEWTDYSTDEDEGRTEAMANDPSVLWGLRAYDRRPPFTEGSQMVFGVQKDRSRNASWRGTHGSLRQCFGLPDWRARKVLQGTRRRG